MKRFPLLNAMVGLLMWSCAAQAQPYSKSMAQCAGLMGAMAHHMSSASHRDKLIEAQEIWFDAAVTQAESEAGADPRVYVLRHMSEAKEDWIARGKLAALTQEFRDWTRYCRALGKNQGIVAF